MEKAARRGDLCTGHDGCTPRPAQRGSPDVTVNDRASLRVADPFVPHGCPDHPPHPGKVKAGSGTVTINDLPAARVGDAVDCGSALQTGSGDVYIGE
jgi:uncharacterized Zn-binding protein involved in type VI secretion